MLRSERVIADVACAGARTSAPRRFGAVSDVRRESSLIEAHRDRRACASSPSASPSAIAVGQARATDRVRIEDRRALHEVGTQPGGERAERAVGNT